MVLQPGDFVVGPREARARVGWWWRDGGGIDIDYCAFPTCPGNPRGIMSAPALCFCMLLPPPSSPTLSTSHRQLSTREKERERAVLSPSLFLSVSRFLSFSLSLLALTLFPLLLHPSLFRPCLSLRAQRRPRESTHPRIFSPRIDSVLRSRARARVGVRVTGHRGISSLGFLSLASFIPPETSTARDTGKKKTIGDARCVARATPTL